ncbi:hypothetical protein ASE74_17415 [Pedobacter sp. Leaf216]|uniref:hypothetical protein n=1 Tax=Pedobacter sp. Leaf216 TaxID=1735684 RepID=UPI0006FE18F5|nr:hypothetical protein [Pedobacter sp. Leaf216]KQM77044.1 hypothetical protein ASE74_17415 [Pedobacter sp. Leaf216]
MSSKYKILYFFQNTDTVILEIKRLDLPANADAEATFHWLYFDKITGSLIKLWFRSMDSSNEIEERYFEQGYLKFNKTEATYIEKHNSSQQKLNNMGNRAIGEDISALLENYLK